MRCVYLCRFLKYIGLVVVAELDYLTSSNFMDMLDTGVLICHLARRIQGIAKDIVQSRRALLGDDAVDAVDGASTALLNGSPDGVKQAQQYLQALLRSANNHANLLAAAKVSYYYHYYIIYLYLLLLLLLFHLRFLIDSRPFLHAVHFLLAPSLLMSMEIVKRERCMKDDD